MLSAVSSLIVEDLDKSLLPVRGITESQDIKPFTLLTEKTPRRWIPFARKQYMVHNFLVSPSLYYIFFLTLLCLLKIKHVLSLNTMFCPHTFSDNLNFISSCLCCMSLGNFRGFHWEIILMFVFPVGTL